MTEGVCLRQWTETIYKLYDRIKVQVYNNELKLYTSFMTELRCKSTTMNWNYIQATLQ